MKNKIIPAIFSMTVFAASSAAFALDAATLNAEANICLEYLKPRLSDPRAAYVGNISKDGTVLTMALYGKSVLGSGSPSTVSCEIKNSRLDEGWTKIHLERLKWR